MMQLITDVQFLFQVEELYDQLNYHNQKIQQTLHATVLKCGNQKKDEKGF